MHNIDTYARLLAYMVSLFPIMHSPSCITYYIKPPKYIGNINVGRGHCSPLKIRSF